MIHATLSASFLNPHLFKFVIQFFFLNSWSDVWCAHYVMISKLGMIDLHILAWLWIASYLTNNQSEPPLFLKHYRLWSLMHALPRLSLVVVKKKALRIWLVTLVFTQLGHALTRYKIMNKSTLL